ncbi:MAG: protein-L-isoaspartate O-methyltransferase [Sphingomonadaceae bacterium]
MSAVNVPTPSPEPFTQAREAMIESQLKPCGIVSPAVVSAFYAVPREEFVLPERRLLAYIDAPQPLVDGRELYAPLTLGRLLEKAQPEKTGRALVVGAGNGYTAAVLSHLVAETIALEENPALASRARELLSGYDNVEIVEGPLADGWPTGAPYDLLVMDGAIARELPVALVRQLKDGGHAVAVIVGEDGVGRAAIGRRAGESLRLLPFAEAPAAVLPSFERVHVFQF